MVLKDIKSDLDRKVKQYNHKSFIALDPISIPHQFTKKEDIEIAGLFAAVFSWGQRITILNKSNELMERMKHKPHDFILNHTKTDLKRLVGFKHRTFNDTDLLYFVAVLHDWYKDNESLETAFTNGMRKNDSSVENGLNHFRNVFFNRENCSLRTRKHIPSPLQKSSCKRINMYLRWMVRKDKSGVDFGIWNQIKSAQLICPLDVHVQRVAIHYGILTRTQADWQAAIELTNNLKKFDSHDPVKYDFALFGSGVNGDGEWVMANG